MNIYNTEGNELLPQFETFQIPNNSENSNILRLISGLSDDLKASLISTLSTGKPTKLGEPLGMGSRASYGFVRKITLHDGSSVVLKRAAISLTDLRERDTNGEPWKDHSRWGNSQLVDNLQKAYFHETGKQLNIEQLIGILDENVTDISIGKRDRYYWSIYHYYTSATNNDFPYLHSQMVQKTKELSNLLTKLGYIIPDGPQLIPIIGENHTLDFVLIDTEGLRKITP